MIFAFTGQKGGSSKTTTAVCLAVELQERGAKVLLVDGDPQLSARVWADTASRAGKAAPVTVALSAAGMVDPSQLPRLAEDYAHVVIDCPPAFVDVQRAALMVADVAIVPAGQGPTDAWALTATALLVKQAQSIRPALRGAVLLSRVQTNTVLGREARAVLEQAGLPVMKTAVPARIAFMEALAAGMGITTYAPADPGAVAIRALVDELLPRPPKAPRTPKKGKTRG